MVGAIEHHSVARLALVAFGLVSAGAVAVAAFNSLEPASPMTLWPAKVPPQVGLCTEQLSYDPDGNVAPLFCSSGEINTLAWAYMAQEQLRVMSLGPRAGAADVRAAVIQDLTARESAAAECSAAQLAAAYYGWNFHIKPTLGLRLDCPIQE